jgi:hypothetical protein
MIGRQTAVDEWVMSGRLLLTRMWLTIKIGRPHANLHQENLKSFCVAVALECTLELTLVP